MQWPDCLKFKPAGFGVNFDTSSSSRPSSTSHDFDSREIMYTPLLLQENIVWSLCSWNAWLVGKPCSGLSGSAKKVPMSTTNNNRMPQAQNHEASQAKSDDPEIRISKTGPSLEPWPQKRIQVCHARRNNLAHLWWCSLIIKELGEYFSSGSQ